MQTIKIKYKTTLNNALLINQYQQQYNCVVRFGFNRLQDDNTLSQPKQRELIKSMNNTDLINSWLEQSAIYDIKALYVKNGNNKVIFGGKKLFNDRLKGLISKETFKSKRMLPLTSVGEAIQKGNRLFKIQNDLNIIFKPCKGTALLLETSLRNNYKKLLLQLYRLQEHKICAITYKLDKDYIYITFDELYLKEDFQYKVDNRVCSIDLNPNYIGFTITDWKSENEYKVIKSGVYHLKALNDIEYTLKGLPSTDVKRLYLNDKRKHELMHIAKSLIDTCIHYKVSLFGIEDLSITSSDKEQGKGFNKLCNNVWIRNAFINNLNKRCVIHNIKFLKVKAAYSSFIGNFIFRSLDIPDMCLSAFEIGRRTYEWNEQYIKKTKDKKKNIIFLDLKLFKNLYLKSLEEFKIHDEFKDLKSLYNFLKNSKLRYRVSLEDLKDHLKFYRLFSIKSKIGFVTKVTR